MVVSLFGAVRYGIIFLNGESCLGHRLGIMPETSEKAWLCGEGDHGQMERELSQSFRFFRNWDVKRQKLKYSLCQGH